MTLDIITPRRREPPHFTAKTVGAENDAREIKSETSSNQHHHRRTESAKPLCDFTLTARPAGRVKDGYEQGCLHDGKGRHLAIIGARRE